MYGSCFLWMPQLALDHSQNIDNQQSTANKIDIELPIKTAETSPRSTYYVMYMYTLNMYVGILYPFSYPKPALKDESCTHMYPQTKPSAIT